MKYVFLVTVLVCTSVNAQFSGSLDSFTSWYLDDDKIKLEDFEAANRLRTNTYLKFDYQWNHFTTGIQVESYEKVALLNYSPKFEGTNLGTYYLNYRSKHNDLEVTFGHFYEKFGNGLLFRTWEDKPLGVANSIVGRNVHWNPVKDIELKSFYGKQRNGFANELTNSTLFGMDATIKLSNLLNVKNHAFGVGFGYVNRNEETDIYPRSVYLNATRAYYKRKNIALDVEYVFKSKDALVEFETVNPNFLFDGDALLFNLSYSKKGIGINANLRRMENFGFYSERELNRNSFNEGLLNYIPSLTKQYDYSLTNIYVYQAQPFLVFEPEGNKAGEIGGQFDLFYTFQKGSFLGGKNGTSLALNFSNWYGLKGRFDAEQRKYAAEFIGFGEKFYTDNSIEIRKNVSQKWTSTVTYLNQYYNAKFVEETTGEVHATTVVWDNQYNFKGSKTLKLEVQHQWAEGGFGNWAGNLLEYNFNSEWSVFNANLYNYGNKDKAEQINYYTFGSTFSKNATRVQMSYGRQRGGLICVGGVCRFVPESAGFNLNVNYSF